MENLIYSDERVLSQTHDGTPGINLQLNAATVQQSQSIILADEPNVATQISVADLSPASLQQLGVTDFQTNQHLAFSAEPSTVDEAVRQLQIGPEDSGFEAHQAITMPTHSMQEQTHFTHLQIESDSSVHTPQTLQIGANSLQTVKLENVITSTAPAMTVGGQQYFTLQLSEDNARVLQALNASKPLTAYKDLETAKMEETDPEIFEEEPRVKHVLHTYDRIKLSDDKAQMKCQEQEKNSENSTMSADETTTTSTEPNQNELEFEEEMKTIGASAPSKFIIGPPSGSEDEEDGISSGLIKGVVTGNYENGDNEEDRTIDEDEIRDPTYQLSEDINEEDFEEENSANDKDEFIVNQTGDSKRVIVKRKHTLPFTTTNRKFKTKMHSEDPALLEEIYNKYNQLCIFCHKKHEENCLIWDPMEKYQDIDQVGPPYTYGMPDQFLMGLSRIYTGSYSLFARDDIPAFTQFGPLKGRIVDETEFRKISLFEIDLENFWPIEASENDELMIENWLDTSDVEISNWLKFLQTESAEADAPDYNVQRITKNGEIFFVTTQHILSGEELFMQAMEPPYRVYHNLKEVNRTGFACGLFHNMQGGSQTLLFDNMIHYVRHHLFVHSIHPGVFSCAYVFNCGICGEECFSKANRIKHMTEVHRDKENIEAILKRDRRCYYCKKHFSTQAMLGHHIKYNHPREENILSGFQCPICKAKVKTKSTLRKHMQDSHLPVNVTCDLCGKVLKNKGTLKVHVMKIHEKKGMKKCMICSKEFSDTYQLRVHSLSHSKLRPFECQVPLCSQASTTKQCLQKHYKVKHGFSDDNMPEITRTIEIQDIPTFGV